MQGKQSRDARGSSREKKAGHRKVNLDCLSMPEPSSVWYVSLKISARAVQALRHIGIGLPDWA
jgi:hypothetical protein